MLPISIVFLYHHKVYTVPQKKSIPIFFRNNLVRCHPILPILGRNVP